MTALSLKVFLVSTGQMKTMRFMQDMSVAEVCQQIREKYEVGGADHGIFQPDVKGQQTGRWLRMDRTLQFYDINTGVSYSLLFIEKQVNLLSSRLKFITRKNIDLSKFDF